MSPQTSRVNNRMLFLVLSMSSIYKSYHLTASYLNLPRAARQLILLKLSAFIMSSPTNLTDSIARLRDRKGRSDIVSGQRKARNPPTTRNRPSRERRFATDSFMLFAYALLGIATVCQLILIVWLDII
jgi:hypothetical protein